MDNDTDARKFNFPMSTCLVKNRVLFKPKKFVSIDYAFKLHDIHKYNGNKM